MSQSHDPLFSLHEHALEKAYQVCPKCGAEVTMKHGKSGAFLGCSNYPTCDYTRALVEQERAEDKLISGSQCPECQYELAVKQGRYGMFIGCSNYPECKHIEEIHQHDDVNIACPQCTKKGLSGELFEKTNRFGKTFYSCNNYPKCKYVLNYPPIAQPCPECAWPVLIKRQMASGEIYMCPQKKCGKKIKVHK